MKKDVIFWDVDTQFDFMLPEGRLYVPGAEKIIAKVSEVRKLALTKGFCLIGSMDWHSVDNREISESADFKETFPPHCIAGEPGSERVGYLGELPIKYIGTDKLDEQALRELIDKEQFHIVLRKESVDVFSNPNTDRLLTLLEPETIVVFGVALEVCVQQTVCGFVKHPGIRVLVLKDVVRGLGSRSEGEILAEFEQMGVEIAESSYLERCLQCG